MKQEIRKNKGILIALIAMIFSITLAQAQPGGQQRDQQGPPPVPNEKQVEKMVTDLSKELSLDKTQEKQVSEIYKAHFEEVRENVEGNKKPSRTEMEKLKSSFEKEVKAVLSKDQKKQFDAYMKKQQPKQGNGRQ
jgi:hypothetical protein